MLRARAAVVAAVTAGLMAIPAVASAHGNDHEGDRAAVVPIVKGLDGPAQVNRLDRHHLVVAEGDTGKVTSVDIRTGAKKTLLDGLYAPSGVAVSHGLLVVALGGAPPPGEGDGPKEGQLSAALVIATTSGKILRTVDLLAYEMKHNPDGQTQFFPDGKPVPDALSNPFSLLALGDRVLVADAGANDVLSVNPRTGAISTFFVPPLVTPEEVPACGQVPNNPGTVGCDSVPTGVARGPDGLIYVSTLGSLVPGAGKVYVLTPRGKVVRVIAGLDAPTGIAVDRDGAVIVSQVTYGAPEGDSAPVGFDPSTVGRLVRIDCAGHRSYAAVTMPIGLVFHNGQLFASAWSVAGMFGIGAGLGQIDHVSRGAFHPAQA